MTTPDITPAMVRAYILSLGATIHQARHGWTDYLLPNDPEAIVPIPNGTQWAWTAQLRALYALGCWLEAGHPISMGREERAAEAIRDYHRERQAKERISKRGADALEELRERKMREELEAMDVEPDTRPNKAKPPEPTPCDPRDEVQRMLDHWMPALGLERWRVVYRDLSLGGTRARVLVQLDVHHVILEYDSAQIERDNDDLEDSIVHELLHVHNCRWERYIRLIKDEDVREMARLEMEHATDNLARVLVQARRAMPH